MKIEASEQPLQKVFSSDFDFFIPLYQRPYAWTTKEAGELIGDLLDNMGDLKKSLEETNPYFLGSVVLALTSQVLKENDWTPGVVGTRQTQLVAALKSLWRP